MIHTQVFLFGFLVLTGFETRHLQIALPSMCLNLSKPFLKTEEHLSFCQKKLEALLQL